jgi:hypothetical protein
METKYSRNGIDLILMHPAPVGENHYVGALLFLVEDKPGKGNVGIELPEREFNRINRFLEGMEASIMKCYIGAKIIKAEPMSRSEFLITSGRPAIMGDGVEDQPGYKVIYPDGYVSWSPKDVFENAYREILPGEIAMIEGEKQPKNENNGVI